MMERAPAMRFSDDVANDRDDACDGLQRKLATILKPAFTVLAPFTPLQDPVISGSSMGCTKPLTSHKVEEMAAYPILPQSASISCSSSWEGECIDC